MAARLGISLTAYRDLEKGGTSVVHGNIIKMAELLETSTEEIVLGYHPSELEAGTLEDVRTQYGNQICILEEKVCDLRKFISTLEGQLADKNEIIKMLKKRLGEVE
jgi:predicted RNase H-like nuclease (RuvC/YqgF family)